MSQSEHFVCSDGECDETLRKALVDRHVQCVKTLVQERGANVNTEDETGRTPLMLAAAEGQDECVNLLLKAGVCVNKSDKKDYTAAMHAVENGHDRA